MDQVAVVEGWNDEGKVNMNRRGFFRGLLGGIAAAAFGDLILEAVKPGKLIRFGGGNVYGFINFPPKDINCRCALLPIKDWIGQKPKVYEVKYECC